MFGTVIVYFFSSYGTALRYPDVTIIVIAVSSSTFSFDDWMFLRDRRGLMVVIMEFPGMDRAKILSLNSGVVLTRTSVINDVSPDWTQ